MKRLRRLRDLDRIPVATSWREVPAAPAGERPMESGSSGPRRALVIAISFGLFAATVGVFFLSWGGDDLPPPADEQPTPAATTSLTITCAEGGATVSDTSVAIGARGVDLTIDNQGHEAFIAMRDPEDRGRNVGLEIGPGSTRNSGFEIPPGRWIVGCFPPRGFAFADVPVAAFPASFEVLDPDQYWPQIQDARRCGESLPEAASAAGTEVDLVGTILGLLLVQTRDEATGDTALCLGERRRNERPTPLPRPARRRSRPCLPTVPDSPS